MNWKVQHPLHGLKVIELAGIGPGPYAAMRLADMGAEVVRVERPGPPASNVPPEKDVLRRNRRSIIVDLRHPDGVRTVLSMAAKADALLEGFRPGVTERLGLGPADCWAVNPRLVYGRMTGWGQSGPLALTAGHDIGYIAVTGALGSIGRAGEAPVPPVNLVGDFGGGSTFLVMGVLAALWEADRSDRGQVVDAAIVDGASSLTALLHGLMAAGQWADQRGSNFLDTGAPWYDTYETADGQWMAVGALEQKFYAEFTRLLGLSEDVAAFRNDPSMWPQLREAIAKAFTSRTRDEWTAVFESSDACVAPVLSLAESAHHPHMAARDTFIDVDGVTQPAPAPRFSRSVAPTPTPPPAIGADTVDVLRDWGIADTERLIADGVVEEPSSTQA
jgi:alpha-methylacyl-CoA racemase